MLIHVCSFWCVRSMQALPRLYIHQLRHTHTYAFYNQLQFTERSYHQLTSHLSPSTSQSDTYLCTNRCHAFHMLIPIYWKSCICALSLTSLTNLTRRSSGVAGRGCVSCASRRPVELVQLAPLACDLVDACTLATQASRRFLGLRPRAFHSLHCTLSQLCFTRSVTTCVCCLCDISDCVATWCRLMWETTADHERPKLTWRWQRRQPLRLGGQRDTIAAALSDYVSLYSIVCVSRHLALLMHLVQAMPVDFPMWWVHARQVPMRR